MGVTFNSYKQYTTNNFEILLKKKDGSGNTLMITTLIMVKIGMYIWSTRFLNNGMSDIIFSLDGKIQKRLVQLLLKKFIQY